VKRRKGPVPEEYQGCTRRCFDEGAHTRVWGQCEKADPPPCVHPAADIAWDPQKAAVVCRGCGEEVTLEKLVDQSYAVLFIGCSCSGDHCTGHCSAGQPRGWSLDPEKVEAVMKAEQEGTRASRSLMVSFSRTEWDDLEALSRETGRTPEQAVRGAVLRHLRIANFWRDRG